MGFMPRRLRSLILLAVVCLGTIFYLRSNLDPKQPKNLNIEGDGNLHWAKLPERYPIENLASLPTGAPKPIPKIQVPKPKFTAEQEQIRKERAAKVKESFVHSWTGYKAHAWLHDEVAPVSGGGVDKFGGWAASLVDALDTLWIMGMKEDFEQAVRALDELDFTFTEELDINVFETTIRYLGGLLGAYDISGEKYPKVLKKAIEVADFLMCAFDTPNRMPITRWPWRNYMYGESQVAPTQVLLSEIASLSLEFTRLSQLIGDARYYDAVARINNLLEYSQHKTKLPGMWPVVVNAKDTLFESDNYFTLGGMSDSAYEYLPKQYLLLGGRLEQPRKMYEAFLPVAQKTLFFNVMNPQNQKLLMSGDARVFSVGATPVLLARNQHLTCFIGGMVAMGGKIFERPEDIETARQLTDACVWSYSSQVTGIGPEVYDVVACNTTSQPSCEWDEEVWHSKITAMPKDDPLEAAAWLQDHALPKGFTSLTDRRYMLRPEAIESVWYMWRITGEWEWQEKAWKMWEAVERHTRTSIASSAVRDVTSTNPRGAHLDSMESFWLAETLKYFWLCFAEWEAVSLDEWVLNTEAHPFRRPTK